MGLLVRPSDARLGTVFGAQGAAVADIGVDAVGDEIPADPRRAMVVNDVGRLFIRNIAMRFDAYNSAGRAGRFSKTI